MTENTKPAGVAVSDLKLTVVKEPVLGRSSKDKDYLKMNLVNNDNETAVWFSGVAFGSVAVNLAKVLKRGSRLKVTSGKVSQKEYTAKDGSPGVENSLIINSALVSTNGVVTEVDEFSR